MKKYIWASTSHMHEYLLFIPIRDKRSKFLPTYSSTSILCAFKLNNGIGTKIAGFLLELQI